MSKQKKNLFFSFFLIISLSFVSAQTNAKIHYFNLQDVRLLDGPFKHAEDMDLKYLLDLNPDRLLAPYLREAGLTPKAENYPNWENTGLDGHIAGHYVSALSSMYASTGNAEIKNRLDYMISELKKCQDANGDGYIGGVPGGKIMWKEIKEGKINAGSFGLNGKWVPLYNIHKMYAGLRDAYLIAGNPDAKGMLIKMTDWAINLVSGLTDDQIQEMLRSEHGGLNEIFADVAGITGNEKYLTLAKKFSHQFILQPLLKKEDKLTGLHANTQIPKVIGFERISEINDDQSWEDAARFFWDRVVNDRSVVIGGNSVSEHFNPTDDFSKMLSSVEGPETCNSYNMLRLTKMLYQNSLEEKYINYYERTLYNHILSTQNPNTGGLVYFTPMRPGHYRVYSQTQTSFWCCVGSGMENHSKYGEMIYGNNGNDLYVNLFIPSKLNWKEKKLEVVQETNFPEEARTQLTIFPKKTIRFVLKIRYPEWVQPGKLKITLNGKEIPSENQNGYIAIERKWKRGDKVIVEMPMRVTVEQIPDKSNYYSFLYGPVVLAARTSTENMDGLFADDSRGGHIAHGIQISQKEMPIIIGEKDDLASLVKPVPGKPLTFMLTNLFPEKYSQGLKLIPFFKLQESRYIIYFAQATADEAKKIQKKIDSDEQEKMRLENMTVDEVVSGEQQPENDHMIQFENSKNGFVEDIHWREANGWFSYQLKNKDKKAKSLYVKYLNADPSRNFDIQINDKRVASLSLTGRNGNELQTAIYSIPESELDKENLTVKFVSLPGSTTAKIAAVRLLSQSFNKENYAAYLFVYFTGNRVEDEAIRFGISKDGFNYYALNNNNPVIDSKTISSTGGVRDPHILRGQNGKTFYMVATDMTSNKGWDSNRAMVLLKSTDLINWKSSVVNIQKKYKNQEDLKRVWAPQTIYDPAAGKYMIYWSMQHGSGPDIIYYAYANDDFTDIVGEPKQLFFPENKRSCIDGDIVYKDGMYYMFYKTEGHGNGIKLATTLSLTSGKWTEYPDYKQQTKEAVEGAGTFKLIDSDKYILMYDVYMKGKYQFTESTDLQNFSVIDQNVSMDFHPRHGTIIPITQRELERLTAQWGTPEKFPESGHNPVLKGFYADPSVLYSNKTHKYYIYPTSDGYNGWSGTYFKTFSSSDLYNWNDEGVILDLKKDLTWADRNAWAPAIVEKKIKGQYKYFYYFTAAQKVGVAYSDNPSGPFTDSGQPLINFKPVGIRGGQEIDPEVFTDPKTNKSYLYWGNGYMAVAELNQDMISIKKNTIKVIMPDKTFREGTCVFYRNGRYYFLWSVDDTRSVNYSVRYGVADSPTGPIFIPENNLILSKDPGKGIYGTGHNSVLKVPNKEEWYIVYHRFNRPDGIRMGDAAGFHREVCIDRMFFDENGNIKKVIVTP
ncbi:MAG: beta-L-arabinofuranosidase domain-containing protein [Paludibacteraceae bacterium]